MMSGPAIGGGLFAVCAPKCNTMQYNTMQYNTMQYNAMQCNAMQCNKMQCNAIYKQMFD